MAKSTPKWSKGSHFEHVQSGRVFRVTDVICFDSGTVGYVLLPLDGLVNDREHRRFEGEIEREFKPVNPTPL